MDPEMSKSLAFYFAVTSALTFSLPAHSQSVDDIGAEADKALYCGGIFASMTQFDISAEDKALAEAKSQVAFTQAVAALEERGIPDSALSGLLERYVDEAMTYFTSVETTEGRYSADECNELVGG